jgi:hypothetical protein
MAENTAGIGTALAEGTQARPYSGTPITNAVKFGIQSEIKRQATEAAAEAKRQKALAQLQKMKTLKGSPLHPLLQSGAETMGSKIYDEYVSNINDPIAQSGTEQTWENFKNEGLGIDAQVRKDASIAAAADYVMNPKVRKALNSYSKEDARKAADSYDDIDKIIDYGDVTITDHPVFGKIVGLNRAQKTIDFNNEWDILAKRNLESQPAEYVSAVNGDQTRLMYKTTPSPEVAKRQLDIFFNEKPDAVHNAIYKNEGTYNYTRKYVQDAVNKDPSILEDGGKMATLLKNAAIEISAPSYYSNLENKYTIVSKPNTDSFTFTDSGITNKKKETVMAKTPLSPSILTAMYDANTNPEAHKKASEEATAMTNAHRKLDGLTIRINQVTDLGGGQSVESGKFANVFLNPHTQKPYMVVTDNTNFDGMSFEGAKFVEVTPDVYKKLLVASKLPEKIFKKGFEKYTKTTYNPKTQEMELIKTPIVPQKTAKQIWEEKHPNATTREKLEASKRNYQ